MKKMLISLFTVSFGYLCSQPCTPQTQKFAQSPFIISGVTNMGDLWTEKSLTSGGLEYPKRTPQEIASGVKAAYPIFSGGIWLSARNGSQLNVSAIRYRIPVNKAHFFPGPIRLSDAKVNPQSCLVFDNVWSVKKMSIREHIDKWGANLLPISSISQEILNWPAKGNKLYTTVPIEDDMAPFADVNGNGIYDPEYGDYPIIKGDEAFFSVFNDISSGRLDSPEKPIGVEVHLMTHIFNEGQLNSKGTALFQDCKITKKTPNNADEFIFGLYLDTDLGNYADDYIGCDTASNTGYTYNADGYDENTMNRGYLDNPPVAMTSFIRDKMAAFSFHLNPSNTPHTDPNSNVEYRNFMEGKGRTGENFTVSPSTLAIGFPSTKFCFYGNPSSPSEWSMVSQNYAPSDLRYNMNTDKSTLFYNQPKEVSFVTYFHKFAKSSFKPNIRDSVIPSLNKIKSYYRDSILNCNLNISAQITADTNGLKKGKITVTNISGAAKPYYVRWSSNETTESISGKDSGTYRLVVIDANNCMQSKSFFIPRVKKGTVSIGDVLASSINIYPNPTADVINIVLPPSIALLSDENESSFILFNTLGQSFLPPISSVSRNDSRYQLDIRQLHTGTYFLQIRDRDDRLIKTERVVISR